MKRNDSEPAFAHSLQNYQSAVKQLLGQIEVGGYRMSESAVEESFKQLLRLNKRIAAAFQTTEKDRKPQTNRQAISSVQSLGPPPTVHTNQAQIEESSQKSSQKSSQNSVKQRTRREMSKSRRTVQKARMDRPKSAIRGAQPLINTRLGVKK